MSGTAYSVADTRYCAGLSKRMTENIPILTSNRLHSSVTAAKPSEKQFRTSPGRLAPSAQQLQAREQPHPHPQPQLQPQLFDAQPPDAQPQPHSGPTTEVPRTIGSTVSTTATGLLVLPSPYGQLQGPLSSEERKTCTHPSPPKRTAVLSTIASPLNFCV